MHKLSIEDNEIIKVMKEPNVSFKELEKRIEEKNQYN